MSPANKIKVFVVDDNNLGIDLLIPPFKESGKLEFVGRANTGEDCLSILKGRSVDVVLMDIGLPGIDGVETVERLQKQLGDSAPRIIFLTNYGDKYYADRAYALDASIIGKNAGIDYLINTIDRVSKGEQIINRNPKGILSETRNAKLKLILKKLLTQEQIDIACMIRSGKTAGQIAAALGEPEHYVNNQRRSIFDRLSPIHAEMNAPSLSAIMEKSGLCDDLDLDLDNLSR